MTVCSVNVLDLHSCHVMVLLFTLCSECVCVFIVGVGGHCTHVEIGDTQHWPSQQGKPVCTAGHQSSRAEGESEGGMYIVFVQVVIGMHLTYVCRMSSSSQT